MYIVHGVKSSVKFVMDNFQIMNSKISSNKNEIEIGNGQRVKLYGKKFEGIKFLAGTNKKTTSHLELRNVSDRWIAYKVKCTFPINFTIHPASSGLLRPLDGSQRLRFALLPGYDMNVGESEFVFETVFVDKHSSANCEGVDVDPTVAWQETIKNDLSITRFPIQFVGSEKEADTETPVVILDEYPTKRKPTIKKQRAYNFLERLRRENLVTPSLFAMLFVFVFYFLVGYFIGGARCCQENA